MNLSSRILLIFVSFCNRFTLATLGLRLIELVRLFCLGNMTLDAYMLTLAHQSEMNEAQAAQAELRATIWRFHERSGRTEIRHHVELWNTHAERHVATLPHLVV